MENITFESAIKRLEEIVKLLESADAELDNSLKLFEEGVKLCIYCNNALSEAEQKISILTKDQNGNVKKEDFIKE